MFPLLPCWGHGSVVGFMAPVLRHVTPEVAGRFAEILEPSRGLWLTNAAEFNSGHSGLALGALAMARGDLDAAITDFDEALAAHDVAGEVPARAQLAVVTIEALVERDADRDRDHARRLADEVAASCERHGIAGLTDRAAALVD